jgi:uncharacterized membrane protein
MSLEQIAMSIQSTSLSDALKDVSWIVPLLQSIHILMIGVVFVSMLVVSLRVLGRVRVEEPLASVWRRFAPFFWTGIIVMALTGSLLVLAEPVREFMTLSFRIKVVLLVIGIASAAMFGRSVRKAAVPANSGRTHGGIRVAVVATVALWLAIIFLGRAIAYDTSVWGGWSPVKSLGGAGT